MIDMHCHLDLYPNPKDIVQQCVKENMYVLSVTTTPKAWQGTKLLAEGCKRIRTSLGLHPQLAHERYQEIDLFDELVLKAKYVGEIGLDGGKDYTQYQNIQISVLEHILNSTQKAGGRIMSIHCRSAVDSFLDCLTNYQDAGIPILHWFTGTQTQLQRAISLGCWFSVSPAMLATKKGKSLVEKMPKERVLTETDGPFARLNQKILMPWDVKKVIPHLSEVWKINPEETNITLISNLQNILKSIV
jgi:TatD DNase family protein